MEKLKEKYASTMQLLQNIEDYYQSLQEEQKALDKQFKEIDYKSNEFKDYMEKSNDLKEKQDKNELLREIIINNLLSIQQDLLEIALDYFKENYKNKRLGQKTKEKYQNEVQDLINKNYNIDIYCCIRQKDTYNGLIEYEISIYYKDYRYNSTLKNESIIYNITRDEEHLYYYNKIEYINIDNIDQSVNEIYQNMANAKKELETLEKVLNGKIDEYNKVCVGSLNYRRINHVYLSSR